MTSAPTFSETLQRAFLLHQDARLDEAELLYRKLLAAQRHDFNVLHLLGLVCFQTGRYAEADALMGEALQLDPNDASAASNHGLVLLKLKRPEEALKRFTDAIKHDPDAKVASANLAVALAAMGRHEEALQHAQRLVARHPDFIEGYCREGHALHSLGRDEEAVQRFTKALEISPTHGDALAGIVACYLALDRPSDVERYASALIKLDPGSFEALMFQAARHEEADALEDALKALDAAAALRPEEAEVHVARSKILGKLDRPGEALDACDVALAADPNNVDAGFCRGIALELLLDYPAALKQYERVIELDPEHGAARWNEAYCQLMLGRLGEGFRNYEWRGKNPYSVNKPRTFAEPLWLGDFPIKGKRILLYPEQGYGDTFQFLRYVGAVRDTGAEVFLEVQRGIRPLLLDLLPSDHVYQTGEVLPAFDVHCPLPSLPLACRTDEHSIPNHTPYLFSSASRVSQWSSVLGEKKGLRIGVAWSGNPDHVNDLNRSMTFDAFAHAFSPDDELICLQKLIREEDFDSLEEHPSLRVFDKAITDFADTAALIELVDVVVTIDTGVAHLAAAMNKPTWILIDTVSDWRWQHDRTDSPWYPSVKLYRQTVPKRWKEVLARVKHDLGELRPRRRGFFGVFARR